MTSLFKHQAECVIAHWDKKSFGLWHEMGVGKTLTLLEMARQLHSNHRIGGFIVIAPAEVYLTWLSQLKVHTPEISAVAWDSGNPPRSLKNIEWLVKTTGLKMLAINIEALSRDKPPALMAALKFILGIGTAMLVIDESSCIKNPKAKGTRNVLNIRKHCSYFRTLNGTPGVESPFDTWQQLEFLQPGCTGYNYFMFTKTYGVWQKQYFGPRSFDKCVGYRNIDHIRRLLEDHGQFLKKEECVDLPPKLYERYEYDLPEPVRAAYNEIKRKRVLELNGQLITHTSAMSLVLQLHNITTGFVRHDDASIEWVTKARINSLLSLLDRLSGKAIIFCNSRAGLTKLAEVIGEKYGEESYRLVFGDVFQRDRTEYINDFQNDDKVRFFIANQQTAGRGVTLTAASYVIYFRNGYSLEERVQSEDRAHRIGQTKSVTIVDIVARGTIDERVVELLQQKRDVASQLLDMVKHELENGP